MSGFTNVTGFAAPTSFGGFLALLQNAAFRGVPFHVIGAQVRKGRRLAVHEYPFVDGGWPEDMGRALRVYSFVGYLIGDIAPAMQLALDNALEQEGEGLLLHPTLGAVKVKVLAASTSVHRDHARVIEVAFEFIEAGNSSLMATVIATVVAVLAAAGSALTGCNTSLGHAAGPAALNGSAVTSTGQGVVAGFASATAADGGDATAIIGMATALPRADASTTFGRYGAGSATVALPDGTTVAGLQAQLAAQRAAITAAAGVAEATAAAYTAVADLMTPLAALVEAMRAGVTNPADQVRVLLNLVSFKVVGVAGDGAGLGAAMATMRDATAAACRRAALVSLARATAAYQPISYDDAAALRSTVAAALDGEITAAGDAGEDDAYGALKTLRAAVVRDLTVRGASLPRIVTVALPLCLPSLAIAQRLYRDATRADEIAGEAGAIHPAFCPVSFKALSA